MAGSVILLVLSVVLNYYPDWVHAVSYLVLTGALLLLGLSLFLTVEYHVRHSKRYPERSRASAVTVPVILVVGVIIASYIFVTKEPYNDWEYEATLECTVDCEVDLPIPMIGKDDAFFTEKEVRSEGSGYVQINERRYEGEDILVLTVQWSGNLTVHAGRQKDYRPIPVGRYGLWNSTLDRFVVVGRKVPDDRAPFIELHFRHERIAQEPEDVQWSIEGDVVTGVNMFEPTGT